MTTGLGRPQPALRERASRSPPKNRHARRGHRTIAKAGLAPCADHAGGVRRHAEIVTASAEGRSTQPPRRLRRLPRRHGRIVGASLEQLLEARRRTVLKREHGGEAAARQRLPVRSHAALIRGDDRNVHFLAASSGCLSAWFAVTVFCHSRAAAARPAALVPRWTFFAPNPGEWATIGLSRLRRGRSPLMSWTEIDEHVQRSPLKRYGIPAALSQAVIDCCQLCLPYRNRLETIRRASVPRA